MVEKTDRTWPLPKTPWVMRMTWSELLFAHWALDPDVVRRWLPEGLQLDTREGKAWVGVVPFLMSKVTPRLCPPLPRMSRFLELNLRTYVSIDGKPGVWFLSLDAESPFAVRAARATFNLPYKDAVMSMQRSTHGEIEYESRRTHRGEPTAQYAACYSASGETFYATPGTLEHWLTARYCLYSVNRHGKIYRGEIDHPPWQLAEASYRETRNTMGCPFGFEFEGDPHVLVAKPVEARAWALSRCEVE
ncbi:YqjF family protein [Rhodopirellula sallentina]|uniref:Uncharacterized protein n=1 Tax=Rhodopirellula sallentina SM41 TaxID=1263870 RepID=M5U8F1_9BACT|nr:DUF2071 domain-containing protein [Rhodopirellula sallentina]EMI57742.1 hypothetical protein RSSM_00790 [Rhodopirellula sallentina SM41]